MDIGQVIDAEADRLAYRVLGALERDDLLSCGWLAALTTPDSTHPAHLRLRIRGAMKDALRGEWRAQGRVPYAVRWPVYWPTHFHRPPKPYRVRRCQECQLELTSMWAKRCPPCAKLRRLVKQRLYNKAYYSGGTP